MKPHSYTSIGIILSKKNLGEADKLVTIFSKEFGKITLVAKGVRKPKSRKRGHMEMFGLIKFQAVLGKNLDILTEVETINNFKKIRTNLKKISLAYYFCEVLSKITNDNESNSNLHELLHSSLNRLSNENQLKDQRLKFIHDLLVLTGFHPDGEKLIDHDRVLEDVIERKINSLRVGKRMQMQSV